MIAQEVTFLKAEGVFHRIGRSLGEAFRKGLRLDEVERQLKEDLRESRFAAPSQHSADFRPEREADRLAATPHGWARAVIRAGGDTGSAKTGPSVSTHSPVNFRHLQAPAGPLQCQGRRSRCLAAFSSGRPRPSNTLNRSRRTMWEIDDGIDTRTEGTASPSQSSRGATRDAPFHA